MPTWQESAEEYYSFSVYCKSKTSVVHSLLSNRNNLMKIGAQAVSGRALGHHSMLAPVVKTGAEHRLIVSQPALTDQCLG